VPFALSPTAPAACGAIAPGSDATVDCGNMGPNPGHICIRCAGEFVVGLAAPGSAHIGFSQLVPGAWGSFAGLPVSRLGVETLMQMGITTIRQGGTVSQSFKWKDWIPVSQPWLRPSMGHTWGDSLIGSWGLFEFIDMCMAARIKPIVTLAYDLNAADDWADLVEFMYGDNTTTWGARRIADGHPQIYDLQTMECVRSGARARARARGLASSAAQLASLAAADPRLAHPRLPASPRRARAGSATSRRTRTSWRRSRPSRRGARRPA